MSFPRLFLMALGLPLLTAACGAPVALTAVSYGADGVSLAESGKSTSDHFISMVSRKDCALWRRLRNRNICEERQDGHDPYQVDYDQAGRMPSEDGVSYAPPLHAAADAPPTSWTEEAYKPTPAPAPVKTTAAAAPEAAPVAAEAPPPVPAPAVAKPAKSGKKKHKVQVAQHVKAVRKLSPSQVASAP